jgi:hypothetical protein
LLNQRFLQALLLDFDAHGREAIEECRKQSPLGYVKVLAHLVPREMKVEHSQSLKSMSDEELPKPLIDSMVATGSAEIRWVDSLNDRGLEHPPSISEWIDAFCGSFTEQEYNTMIELGAKRSNVSQQERLLYQLLNDKWEKKVTCERHLIFSHRERLPPP